jgi:hypothetical protein
LPGVIDNGTMLHAEQIKHVSRRTFLSLLAVSLPRIGAGTTRAQPMAGRINAPARIVTAVEAFGGSKLSRTGWHNDAFLVQPTDLGSASAITNVHDPKTAGRKMKSGSGDMQQRPRITRMKLVFNRFLS